MNNFRNIIAGVLLTLIVVWMAGCAGCNPPPIPSDMTPTEGPETGGTSVRITGDKFDLKSGVTVKFDGKNITATVTDATSLTFRTPVGQAGKSATVSIYNNRKEEEVVSVGSFKFTDATPPRVVSTEPRDAETFSEFTDAQNVLSSVSVRFSEAVDTNTGTVSVIETDAANNTREVPGEASGSGDMLTFAFSSPLTAEGSSNAANALKSYKVTVASVKDLAGNTLQESYQFSFSIEGVELVSQYTVQSGDTLPVIAAKPQVYGDSSKWPRLVEANQDDYDFDPNRIVSGQRLWVPRGAAWGDSE
jgi:LysM repeat protein